jgi:hypothetical protein
MIQSHEISLAEQYVVCNDSEYALPGTELECSSVVGYHFLSLQVCSVAVLQVSLVLFSPLLLQSRCGRCLLQFLSEAKGEEALTLEKPNVSWLLNTSNLPGSLLTICYLNNYLTFIDLIIQIILS